MKKIIAICMAALMLMAALPVSFALAGGEIGVVGSVDKAAACSGETVTLTVSIKDNPGLVAWRIYVAYDEAAVTLTEQKAGDVFPAGATTFGPLKSPANAMFTDAIHPDVEGDGSMAIFTFKVNEGYTGNVNFDVYVVDEMDFYDAAWGEFTVKCEDASLTAGHSYDNACDATCNGCGATREVAAHPYEGNVTKPADCGNAGEKTYTCPICGDNYKEAIPATGAHTYANACDADCDVCGAKREAAAHQYEGVVTKPADCGNAGVKTYTCSVCGDSYTEEIPATGAHTYDNACDKDCNVCGGTREVADHVYTNECDADCNECGATREAPHSYTYVCDATCAICGELTNPNAAHKVGKVDAHEAECHRDGNVEYWTCSYCGAVWTDEAMTEVSNHKNIVIPALGGEIKHVEAKAPTATENGNIEYWYCEECEQFWADEALTQLTNSKNVIIAALGEEPVEPSDPSDPTKPTGENVVVTVVIALIALIAAGAVVVFAKKKA
ncbi:MAG: hypothetical protein IJN76_04900 [Clostridia bacterium]|nr:hypothetical protein [Clostridia bacterium]